MRADERQTLRFSIFDVDCASGELRKHGVRIKLHEKPFQVLVALLKNPGHVVTRQELQTLLWPADTFVDFENGLNNAISRLREALGDTAESPRYIETIPRRGYRFLGTVETPVTPAAPMASPKAVASRRGLVWGVTVATVAVLLAGIWAYRNSQTRRAPLDSVAVLPFTTANAQGDSSDEYLSFGMTEALIAELSRIRALKVISQTSILQYKGVRKPLPQIARELGVRAIVEGSVVRDADQLRITVQLIDASTDTHLWAQTYTRKLSDVLRMQSEVAQAIAREVRVQLTPQERSALEASAQVNPQAHDAYLKGRYFLRRAGEESWKKAQSYFEEAVQIDPKYAAAYSGLADYYAQTDSIAPELAMSKAKEYALRALELDNRLADAHVSLGFIHYYGDWDWAGAEREFQRAIEIDPGNVRAHRWYSIYLETMGRHAQAVKEFERAVQSDPLSISVYDTGGNLFFNARDYDRGIEQGRKIKELDPNDPRGYEQVMVGYIKKGEYDRAIAEGEKGRQLTGDPRDPVFLTLLTVAYGRAGHAQKSQELLASLNQLGKKTHVPLGFLAIIHAGLGHREQALDFLEKCYEQKDTYLVRLKASPWFDDLRSIPRFQTLLRKMNFPPDAQKPQ